MITQLISLSPNPSLKRPDTSKSSMNKLMEELIKKIPKICKKTPWTWKLLHLLWKIVEITQLLWDDNTVFRQSLLASLCIVILRMYVRGYNLEFLGFRSKLMQLKKCTIRSQLLNSTNKVALKPPKSWMASSNECTYFTTMPSQIKNDCSIMKLKTYSGHQPCKLNLTVPRKFCYKSIFPLQINENVYWE